MRLYTQLLVHNSCYIKGEHIKIRWRISRILMNQPAGRARGLVENTLVSCTFSASSLPCRPYRLNTACIR